MFETLRQTLRYPDSLVTELSADHEKYLKDATEFTAWPSAILLAETVDDVLRAIKFCRENHVPITARGAGTGLSGGCVASSNALILSTERLKDLEIDPDKAIAVCGAGVITKDLLDAAAAFGLTYPPDPASYTESTLGGNVAEGAGGLRCKRFGVTKDYVIGLEAVTVDGAILRTGIFSENQGLALGDVLIASEGTLAVITRIAVRLVPIPPPGATILVAYDNPTAAAQTVADITAAGIIPTVLEFLDGDAAACSNQYEKTEGLDNAAAILLIETTGRDILHEIQAIREICNRNGCSYLRGETDPEKVEQLWKVRRNLSKAIKQSAGLRISEDVAVPNTKFPVLVEFVARMNAASPLRINAFGHAGDGNLHVNFLSAEGSAQDRKLIEEGVLALMKRTIELGGTLTGEHGIGLAKREYLPLEFDAPTLAAMRKIKEVFDPENLLNPDKLFPLEKLL